MPSTRLAPFVVEHKARPNCRRAQSSPLVPEIVTHDPQKRPTQTLHPHVRVYVNTSYLLDI